MRIRPHTERRPPKTRTKIKEMCFPRVWTRQRDRIPTLGPQANESAMHKTAERPIEVRRVIFSEVSTLHDGPAHNTRSVSRVTDISAPNPKIRHSRMAQLLTIRHRHPVRPVQSYLEDPRDCRNLRIGILPEFSSPMPANRSHTKKHWQLPIQPPGIW